MTARGWLAGGKALRSPAHAPADGERRRNLRMAFERLSASAPTARPDLLPAGAAFKFSDLLQAVLDVAALSFIALFLAVTAAGVGIAFFILFFVRTG